MGPTEIAEEIARLAPISGIRLIGVDGPSASGKSTLAAALAELLAAPVVQIDDFIVFCDLDSWWPRFDAQVLTPLLAGRDARYRVRDWAADWSGDALGGWKTTPWAPTVIVEGVSCTRRATVGRLAYAAWVEAPAQLRLARGVARDRDVDDLDAVRDIWRRQLAVEENFFAADGTRGRADIRIDTSAYG
jgi:uridine kinase